MTRHHPGSDDPILDKVRKLLAKAADPATTVAEAELYNAKAADLIAGYGIDQALLGDETGTATVGDRRIGLDPPYARDKADLLATVAIALGCRCVRMRTRRDRGTGYALHVFGQRPDLERAELLFTSLLLQATTWLVRTPVPAGEHQAAFRRSWLAGFTAAIGRRLEQAEQRAAHEAADRRTATGRSTALVLADRAHEVEHALQEAYPRVRAARARSLSGSGVAPGYRAGERADLGGTRIGVTPPSALT